MRDVRERDARVAKNVVKHGMHATAWEMQEGFMREKGRRWSAWPPSDRPQNALEHSTRRIGCDVTDKRTTWRTHAHSKHTGGTLGPKARATTARVGTDPAECRGWPAARVACMGGR